MAFTALPVRKHHKRLFVPVMYTAQFASSILVTYYTDTISEWCINIQLTSPARRVAMH